MLAGVLLTGMSLLYYAAQIFGYCVMLAIVIVVVRLIVNKHRSDLRLHGKRYTRVFQLESFLKDLAEGPYRLGKARGEWIVRNGKNTPIGIVPAEHTNWITESQNVFKDIAVDPDGTATITIYYANK